MSGLCGWVNFDGSPLDGPAKEALEPMLEAAQFRGPDGRAVWSGKGAALGHLALNVTPEAWHERQPMVDHEAGLVVVADARLDNREDLLGRLQAPAESGDAALLLAAYRRWGAECVHRLLGDFAFAVWDRHERCLFAARDPMGMRGFYYRSAGPRLLFATEAEQILAAPDVPEEVFEPAVGAFLAGEWGSPEWTFFRGISRLPAGHALQVTADGPRTWRYWDIDPEERIRYRRHDEYAEHFRELFTEAVRARLRSRGPVGILLSGGLDSGSIAATAGWLRRRNGGGGIPELRAYSFAFDELRECDERHISDGLAHHYDIPVTPVPADDAWPLKNFPEAGPHRTEPFMLSHQTVLERTFAAARDDGVHLLLSGDRGDLVAGMAIHDHADLFWRGRWVALVRELRMVAEHRRTTFRRMVRKELLRPARKTLAERSPGGLGRLFRRPWDQARVSVPPWLSPQLAELARLNASPRGEPSAAHVRGLARRQRYQAVFTPLHMSGVACTERMHARFGQSFADPWSDVRLARFAMAVPQRALNAVGESKRLTRAAMRGVMPDSALKAARKIVPTPLFDRGIRRNEERTIRALLTDTEMGRRGWVDEARLRAEYDTIRAGGGDVARFWHALSCEMWLRTHGPG